jgi:hypothetical protein
MKRQYLLNSVFLVGLLILVLNDHLLKAQFGNWFTGKLSDFAGLLIFPLFLKFVFPVANRTAIGATLLGFLFWKSSFSQPLIDTYNAITFLPVGRIVDYSDYLAFLILPLSYYVLDNIEKFRFNRVVAPQWQLYIVLPLTLLAFVATSPEDDFLFFDDPTIDSCCQFVPTETDLGNGKIFIPTIFTPDGNGINDYFQVVADANILRLDTFMVIDQGTNDTVFYAINITDIIPENGFDGVQNDTIVAAQYRYLVWVTSEDMQSGVYSGLICSVPCVEPLDVPSPLGLGSCAFASQHNFIDGYDPAADSGEELDCF